MNPKLQPPAMVPVANTGKHNKYVAGRVIPPGETRHFHPSELPRKKTAEAKAEPPAETALQTLSAKSVKDILKELPNLLDEDLQTLLALEKAKGAQARKGVLEGVQNEILERSQLAQFRKDTEALDDTSLANALADWPEGSAERGIIEAVIEARTNPNPGGDGSGQGDGGTGNGTGTQG